MGGACNPTYLTMHSAELNSKKEWVLVVMVVWGMWEMGWRGVCVGVDGTWADQGVRPPGLPHYKPHWNTHKTNRVWKYTTYMYDPTVGAIK